jgi:hypothetical protein
MPILNQIAEVSDLYAEPVNFTYRNKNTFKTAFGGFVTHLIVIALLGYFLSLLLQMFKREIPFLNQTKFISEFPEPINITTFKDDENGMSYLANPNQRTASWPTSLGVRLDGSLITLENTNLRIKVYQLTYRNGIIEQKTLKTKLCDSFGILNQTQFDGLKLDYTYCIDDHFVLSGIQGDENSSWITIKYSNETEMIENSEVKIYDNKGKLQFELYYIVQKIYFDAFDDEVVQNSLEQKYFDNVASFAKIVDCEVGFDELHSYDNYLPDFLNSNYKYYKALKVRSFLSDLNDIADDNVLLQMNFFSSKVRILNSRRFNDVITQISKMGGLIGIMMSLGFFVSCWFVKFDQEETMMNDFYNVIDPKNNREYKKKFQFFIIDNYNTLMRAYCQKKKLVSYDTNNNEENVDDIVLNKSKLKSTFFDKIFHSKSKNEKSIGFFGKLSKGNDHSRISEFEDIKDFEEDLDDDEGLIDSNDDLKKNILKRFFTLKRIENMFNLSIEERDEMLQTFKINDANFNDAKFNFYQNIFKNKKKTKVYYANKIFYDSLKYMGYNNMNFSLVEMLKVIFCSCFHKNKSNKNSTKDNLDDKYLVYNASLQKLGIDFDLVSVLKSEKDLKNFIKIYFDENQEKIFSSINKNTVLVTDEEFENSLKKSRSSTEYDSEIKNIQNSMKEYNSFLLSIIKRGSVTNLEKKLFNIMGLSSDNIKDFCKIADAESQLNHGKIDSVNQNSDNLKNNRNKNSELNPEEKIKIENEIIDMVINNNLK